MSLSVAQIVGIAVGSTVTGVSAFTVGAVALSSLTASPTLERRSQQAPAAVGTLVTRVIDGDTIELAGGDRVRLIGIDTPERGHCGSEEAKAALTRLVEGRRVQLGNPGTVLDQDRYGRLLRYVEVGTKDAGYAMLLERLAAARYDSRDGFDPHPRESAYHAAPGLVVSSCTQLERDRATRLEQAEEAATNAGTFRRIDESATALLIRVQARMLVVRQWRDAKRIAKRAGITLRPGESADQLRRRAEQRLRDVRVAREAAAERARAAAEAKAAALKRARDEAAQRARDAADDRARDRAPAPSSGGSSGGGYTGPRCYAPGGQTWTPC